MLAEMVIMSQHMVAFTGAGISTAAGVPDYRSGYNTVLETGPGCWETAANKKKYYEEQKKNPGRQASKSPANKATLRTSIQKAYPTKTHMGMVELQEKNHLKFVVSQNVDGLHRKSGILPENLAELHGNTNLEVCEKCGREHMRDMRVRNAKSTKEHATGRTCDTPSCGGQLHDTIINFGENLNENILELGFQNCQAADLCLVMGTSLRVTPAADMPKMTALKGGNLVICNLQKTPLDNLATLCIYEKCDVIMELLMKKLGYQIPAWQLKRRLSLEVSKNGKSIQAMGVDSNGAPFTLFNDIKVSDLGPTASIKKGKQPFLKAIPDAQPKQFGVQLQFARHYNEPDLHLTVDTEMLIKEQKLEYLMSFDAQSGQWELVVINNANKDMVGIADFKQVAIAAK